MKEFNEKWDTRKRKNYSNDELTPVTKKIALEERQRKFDKNLENYIFGNAKPFSTVDNKQFSSLIDGENINHMKI